MPSSRLGEHLRARALRSERDKEPGVLPCKRSAIMLHYLFLLLSCFFSSVLPSSSASPSMDGNPSVSGKSRVIRIGCLTILDSERSDQQVYSAIQLAVQDVNRDASVLAGSKLELLCRDSGTTQFQSQAATIDLLSTDVLAIVGPPYSSQVHAMEFLAQEAQVPLISFSASDPTLSTTLPFFCRMSQNDKLQAMALSDVMHLYRLNQPVILFSDDDFGRNGMNLLKSLLEEESGFTVVQSIPLSPAATESDLLTLLKPEQGLEQSMFVVIAASQLARNIFASAYRLGMMGAGYAWIASEDSLGLLDEPVDEQIAKAMQGVISVRSFIQPNPKLQELTRRWRSLDPSKYLGAGTTQISDYALYAYDAVWVVARAINSSIQMTRTGSFEHTSLGTNVSWFGVPGFQKLQNSTDGLSILSNMRASAFDGVTGRISFNETCDLDNRVLQVVNVVQKGRIDTIGFWSEGLRLTRSVPNPAADSASTSSLPVSPVAQTSADTDLSVLKSPLWPGNSTQGPQGYLPRFGKRLRIVFPNGKLPVPNLNLSGDFVHAVFQAAVALLPYNLSFDFVPYGDGSQFLPYTPILREVAAGMYDGAVGDITITSLRSTFVDFSTPFAESGLCLMVPASTVSQPNPWGFLVAFDYGLWFMLLASCYLSAAVFWYLEHLQNSEFGGSPIEQLFNSVWFAFSSSQFHQDITLKTALARFVLITWSFFMFITISSYTASLTSILTRQQLNPPISTLADIITTRAKIGFKNGSSTPQLLGALGLAQSQLVPLDEFKEYVDAVTSGRVVGVVEEWQYVNVILSLFPNKLAVTQRSITLTDWGFAFRQGSALAKDISVAVLNLAQTGELMRLHKIWVPGSNSSSGALGGSTQTDTSLGVTNFINLFIIYFSVAAACCVLYALFLLLRRKGWLRLPQASLCRFVLMSKDNSPVGSPR